MEVSQDEDIIGVFDADIGSGSLPLPSVPRGSENTRRSIRSVLIRRAASPERPRLDGNSTGSSAAGGCGGGGEPSGEDVPLEIKMMEAKVANLPRLTVADFELLALLGRGAYGKVFQVRKKQTGKIYAMKVLKKKEVIEKDVVEQTRAEREVLETVSHAFVVSLRFAFQTASKLYLILDYVSGGELFTRLEKERLMTEEVARFYVAEVLLALEHLHSNDIIYRDLKPENILLQGDGHICLTDFGFAKRGVVKEDGARTFCGTIQYMAPEVLTRSGHGKPADWWSLGVLLFELLMGKTPFHANNHKTIQQKIVSGKITIPTNFTAPCRSLLSGLLKRHLPSRLGTKGGAAEIKAHPFFRGVDWQKMLEKRVAPPYVPEQLPITDVSHFDPKFTKEPAVMTPDLASASPGSCPFVGFSFTSADAAASLLLPPPASTAAPSASSSSSSSLPRFSPGGIGSSGIPPLHPTGAGAAHVHAAILGVRPSVSGGGIPGGAIGSPALGPRTGNLATLHAPPQPQPQPVAIAPAAAAAALVAEEGKALVPPLAPLSILSSLASLNTSSPLSSPTATSSSGASSPSSGSDAGADTAFAIPAVGGGATASPSSGSRTSLLTAQLSSRKKQQQQQASPPPSAPASKLPVLNPFASEFVPLYEEEDGDEEEEEKAKVLPPRGPAAAVEARAPPYSRPLPAPAASAKPASGARAVPVPQQQQQQPVKKGAWAQMAAGRMPMAARFRAPQPAPAKRG